MVPEFDAGAFGGFAGFGAAAPRTGPALFTFGQDLDDDDADPTTSTDLDLDLDLDVDVADPRAGDDGPFSPRRLRKARN